MLDTKVCSRSCCAGTVCSVTSEMTPSDPSPTRAMKNSDLQWQVPWHPGIHWGDEGSLQTGRSLVRCGGTRLFCTGGHGSH
jgi:hypothetical protein